MLFAGKYGFSQEPMCPLGVVTGMRCAGLPDGNTDQIGRKCPINVKSLLGPAKTFKIWAFLRDPREARQLNL